MRTKLLVLIIFSFFLAGSASSQKPNSKILIKGTVLDSKNEPVIGSIIMIDGKRSKTITNEKGKFSIKVSPAAQKIGIFTFGLGMYEEEIAGRTQIDITFSTTSEENYAAKRSSGMMIGEKPEIPDGEQAVDVGYAFIKKKDLTTDITFIDGTKLKYASYPSIVDMISREASGVRRWGNTVIIQEAGNMSGAVSPLIVIDGMYGGKLEDVPPIYVKSISILKGTAAAIYGSRGYGGVILVRTKTYDE
jgi:TonB-dependent starch-binding outer membrane protein SusC